MLTNILLLLIEAAFGFLTILLLARFFMQWARVSFRNQVGHFVVVATDWLVRPVRRVVPGMFGLDMASLLPAWLAQSVLVFLELALQGAPFSGPLGATLGLLGLGLLGLMKLSVYLLMAVVLVSAVLSWVNPYAPAAPIFFALADPFLRPIRRVVPTVANVDLSPLVLLLLLQVVLLVLASFGGGLYPLVLAR
jgi:YggT family protein